MPSPESNPGRAPGDVNEGRRGRGGRDRFAIMPTEIPGVSLRTESGVRLDILRSTIVELASLAKGYAERYFKIDELTGQQKGPNEEIKTLAQTHDGLRGVQSEEDDFVLNVFPRDSITWNRELLKESAGVAYSTVAHEDLVFTISVPTGFQTGKGPIEEEMLKQVLSQALVSLGLSEDDLRKIMDAKVNLRVDEETLEKMIKNGKIALFEGTKQTDTTWAITVAPLKKSPKN